MTLRRAARRLHSWLGILTGLVVFVVAFSGSVYVFEKEIQDCLQDYRYVEGARGPMLPPSKLKSIAEQQLPGETASRVYYEGPRRAAYVQFGNKKTQYYKLVYVDSHDGRVLRVKDMNHDFFHLIFSLHYRLWLRPDIGTTIVDYATLLFILVLLSGVICWWPRSRAAARQHLSIRWKAPWRRKNYDLHRVLGFYAFPVLLLLALTGLVWGFPWFNRAVGWIVSGGATRPACMASPPADPWAPATSPLENVDLAWDHLSRRHADAEVIIVFFPLTAQAPIRFVVNPDRCTYYRTDHYHFDQHSLAKATVNQDWGTYQNATTAGLVRRVNYDVHIGALLGLPGKVLAFCAGLIAASLPVSGSLIWWGRKRKRAKRGGEM